MATVAEVPMRVYPQDEIESHHQELQQSVFELWELSHPYKTLWLFPIAPWPAVASPIAVPLLKKHCLDGPTPQPMHYRTRGPTGWTSMAKTPIMPDRQWLSQFAESAAAQERERERRNHFQSKFGSGTLF